jgi:hypothetical protein
LSILACSRSVGRVSNCPPRASLPGPPCLLGRTHPLCCWRNVSERSSPPFSRSDMPAVRQGMNALTSPGSFWIFGSLARDLPFYCNGSVPRFFQLLLDSRRCLAIRESHDKWVIAGILRQAPTRPAFLMFRQFDPKLNL